MAIHKMNQVERRRAAATAAMPEVKRLVKKFGRAAVGNCMGKIAASERATKKLQAMKKEVAAFEARLR